MNKGYSLAPLGITADAPSVGKAALANEAAFNATFFSQPLTDYAVGFRTDAGKVEALLDFLAPKVQTSRRFQYKKADNGSAFAAVADNDDVRAIGGEFKTVEARGDIVDSHTVSKGLTTVVDRDELDENPNVLEQKVAWLKLLLLRGDAIRAWAVLNAAASNTAKTWSASAGAPDQDLLAALDTAGDSMGFNPNRILFGSTAWQKRLLCLGASDKAAGFAGFSMKPADLAQFLGIDEILISSERYQASASAKSKVTTANVALLFSGFANASTEDASNAKLFWSPAMGGGEYAVFKDETSAENIKVTVMHKSQVVLANSLGIQKITVS